MATKPVEAAAALAARVEELERERARLLAVIEILHEISGTLHFVDILQTIARKMGETFGLDRSSIILADRGGLTARLVASYEDPSIRNLVIDLARYPEIRRAMDSGDTVFVADATSDPTLQHVKGALERRKVRTITVVPIKYQGAAIGCMFLRTFKNSQPFSDSDIKFCQIVAELTAKSLRNAHRYEALVEKTRGADDGAAREADQRRLALIALLQKLLAAFAAQDKESMDQLLSASSAAELERLVGVAMTVLSEEAKGR